MRIGTFAVAAIVSGPAAAQSWQEYSYPDYAFSVTFPANPQVETTTYQVADNRSVPAHVYTVRRSNSILMVTVADLANTGLDERTVIDHAFKTMSADGKVASELNTFSNLAKECTSHCPPIADQGTRWSDR